MEKQKIKAWIQRNKKKIIVIGVGTLLIIIFAGGSILYSTRLNESNDKKVSSNFSRNKKKDLGKSPNQENNEVVKEDTDSKEDTKKSDAKKDTNRGTSSDSSKSENNSGGTSSSGSSGSSESVSVGGNSSNKPSKPDKPAHTHSWEPQYTNECVQEAWDELIKEAWTEKVRNPAKDEYEFHIICNGCKKDFGLDENAWGNHSYEQMSQGNVACGGWTEEQVLVKEGYDTISHPAEYKHHDAVYKDKLTGYKCSCGATK